MEKKLIAKCREIIECDTARISKPLDRMFLIIGFNRNTKENKTSRWERNGKPFHFDYVEEKIIASGNTEKELIESVKEYKRLGSISWEEFLKQELTVPRPE